MYLFLYCLNLFAVIKDMYVYTLNSNKQIYLYFIHSTKCLSLILSLSLKYVCVHIYYKEKL